MYNDVKQKSKDAATFFSEVLGVKDVQFHLNYTKEKIVEQLGMLKKIAIDFGKK